jgi:hypothetical protein
VKKKIIAGGIAITKLKAMADALSFIPTFFTCLAKKLITSKRGIPWKPGNTITLLLLTRKVIGADVETVLVILAKKDILFFH